MEKSKFLYGAMGLIALGMTACSSESPDVNSGVEKDEVRYLRVAIANPHEATRAAEFEDGTVAENAVDQNSIIMDFYDAAGNYITRSTPKDIKWEDKTGDPTPNVGRIGTAIVSVGIAKNQNLPAYVMCYLNPVNWGEEGQNVVPMKELRTVERPGFQNTVTNNFSMNNSCYYGEDAITGQANVKISGTPIDPAKLYKSEAEAGKADDENKGILDIYVERYAAKVKFTAETGDGVEGEDKGIYPYSAGAEGRAYTLKFNAERWTINADAPSMYAIKNFTAEDGGDVATMNQVNDYLGGWKTWNDATNHRSYWSCSPAYYATSFPQVSDNIVDIATDGFGAGKPVGNYRLQYYSYNQICGEDGNGNGEFAVTGADGGVKPFKYALENTVGKAAFASLNPRAAVPSVLLVGNYSVTYNNAEIPANTSFYIYNNNLYFETAPAGVDNAVLMMDQFIASQQILFVRSGNEGAYKYDALNLENAGSALDILKVKHPDQDVRGEQSVPMRFVTLQLSGPGTVLYYRPQGAGDYVQVTEANLVTVNKILWQQLGNADSYKQGKCYYSIPIHHLGVTENPNDDIWPEGAIVPSDWTKVRVGDLGLVRNHVYDINVKTIKGRATAIENLEYPIVPPMSSDNYWIKYRINILNWRIVPAQGGIIL